MAMRLTAGGRESWIRLLILILALTASRRNFPLQDGPSRSESASKAERATERKKKSEGVTPSRRQVESRRLDWVRSLAQHSEMTPSLRAVLSTFRELQGGSAEVETLPAAPCSVSPCPEHLRLFLLATFNSSLPPPA
jgi:hypothetical protein